MIKTPEDFDALLEMFRKEVEGLTEANGELTALQQAFHENFALQCGFCTPGILISMSELLERQPDPTEAKRTNAE